MRRTEERGVSAKTYNNSSLPVYVDGFQTNMAYFQFLSPAEIDRIEVLKDAAALAPFGMRGANGVIWVTTKRGRIGRPRVTVNVRGGVQQPMNLQKPLRTGDYTRLYNEALSNDNGNVWTPYYTADQVARLPDVDWYREVTKKATPYTDADVSVSGGDKTVRYFVLFGYMGQRGIYDTPTNDTLANAGIDRYNIRTNLDMNLFGFLEAKVDGGAGSKTAVTPTAPRATCGTTLPNTPARFIPCATPTGRGRVPRSTISTPWPRSRRWGATPRTTVPCRPISSSRSGSTSSWRGSTFRRRCR
jgi:TonB-dependent SusC/RagA subfamily outer membrane receptor